MLKNGWILLNRRVHLFEYDEYELCKYVVIRWEAEVLLSSFYSSRLGLENLKEICSVKILDQRFLEKFVSRIYNYTTKSNFIKSIHSI